MNDQQKVIVRQIVKNELEKAENIWEQRGSILESANDSNNFSDSVAKRESVPSSIPGHPLVNNTENPVDTFIALVADMRKSSDHLLCAISPKKARVSQLQRVYYETSALLPALEQTIMFEKGSVTEYLGDGVLAFFRVDETCEHKAIYAAHRAAKDCINVTRSIVNEELSNRYSLPELSIGVGMAVSKALVTLVGLMNQRHAKAFGECVFRATKLSSGNNQIYIDSKLENMWPVSQSGGGLRFTPKSIKGVEGYLINYK